MIKDLKPRYRGARKPRYYQLNLVAELRRVTKPHEALRYNGLDDGQPIGRLNNQSLGLLCTNWWTFTQSPLQLPRLRNAGSYIGPFLTPDPQGINGKTVTILIEWEDDQLHVRPIINWFKPDECYEVSHGRRRKRQEHKSLHIFGIKMLVHMSYPTFYAKFWTDSLTFTSFAMRF